MCYRLERVERTVYAVIWALKREGEGGCIDGG
jgi:hypothetical protein